jgi:hypothetical protein
VVLDIGWDKTKSDRDGVVSLHTVANIEELYAVLVDFGHQLYFQSRDVQGGRGIQSVR